MLFLPKQYKRNVVMSSQHTNFGFISKLYELGGPILVLLVALSIVTVTLIIFKYLQFLRAQVGKGSDIKRALTAWEQGNTKAIQEHLAQSKHFIAPVLQLAFSDNKRNISKERLYAEAEQRFMPLEKGFKLLDTIAQISPLLGLLGTVIGMIEAFQALQSAGNQVDPSVLAGGIWVALLTTAAGLTVAMPASTALSWLESRIDCDRTHTDYAFTVLNNTSSS